MINAILSVAALLFLAASFAMAYVTYQKERRVFDTAKPEAWARTVMWLFCWWLILAWSRTQDWVRND